MTQRITGAAGLLLVLLAGAAFSQPKEQTYLYGVVDQGIYRVSVGGRPVGYETFVFTIHYDSLYITSQYRQPLREGDTLRKSQMLVVKHFDNDLILYQSNLTMPGRKNFSRGLSVGDTVVTAFRETGMAGEAMTLLKPPGRLFAIEPNAYALFDLLFRDLATRQGWERRQVNVVMLGAASDSVIETSASSLGSETLRWGNGPVTARKYSLSDGQTLIHAWIGPQGYMLRLEQAGTGLIVEREPPPSRKVGAKKPSSSG